jgi:hypothetical protein
MNDALPINAHISDEYVADQRATLYRLDAAVAANPADTMSRDHAALIRRTLDAAIAATGWLAHRIHDGAGFGVAEVA